MSLRTLAVLSLAATLAACSPTDTDGDGLSDKEEAERGTNPESSDSDSDGLSDLEEIEQHKTDPLMFDTDNDLLPDSFEVLGMEKEIGGENVIVFTDPLSPDSDGDGYEDYDEIEEGHDPMDADDVIYKGGWPYQRYKDDITDRKLTKGIERAKPFARISLKDQHNQKVDLFDFAEQGVPIMMDLSALWCGPCQTYAEWLSGLNPDLNDQYDEIFPGVRDAVDNGDVRWITIMGEDMVGIEASVDTLHEWEDEFPNDNILLLADPEQKLVEFVDLGFWPSFVLLSPDMRVVATNESRDALPKLSEWFSE